MSLYKTLNVSLLSAQKCQKSPEKLHNHRRRTRASPVLTVISLVNRKPWERSFLTPTKSTYLNRSLKNLSQVVRYMTSTAVQNLVEIRPWGASGK